MKPRVAIVGAGVSGLTVAAVFGERGYEPVVFADRMAGETTSAVAAGIWFPYDAEPERLVTAWALVTYGRLLELAREREATGVSMIEFRILSRTAEVSVPGWAEAIGYRMLSGDELGSRYGGGYAITVPLMETPVYLPYLERRVVAAGGSVQRIDRLERLEELPRGDFELIVNCSGYGARELVPDTGVEGRRGQVVIIGKIDRSWAMVCEDPLTYVIPRRDDCVLGGVNEIGASLDVDPETTATILGRCRDEGVDGEPIDSRTGVRPFRAAGVRLEAARLADGRLVIHNYGHGGCGLSLSWGCAHAVFELAAHEASLAIASTSTNGSIGLAR